MGNGFSYGIRRALHAGELYERDEDAITERLQEYLRESSTLLTPSDAPFDENVLLQKPLRALIVPAAVVPTMTSDDETVLTTKRLQKDTGPTFGAAYSKLNPLTLRRVRTIVILHHPTLPELSGKCSITGADELETPTTNLRVNAALREQLLQCPYVNPYLDILSKNKEEKEVSAEIHFPWIAHCLRTTHLTEQVSVLPIMIGNLSTKDEINLGIALKRHFCLQRDILVLLATNLCTWGKELHSSYQPVTALKHLDQRRERQTRKPKRRLSTVEHAVTELDREVMGYIERRDAAGLNTFLSSTDHPISGRNLLMVWLHATALTEEEDFRIDFCHYAQSSSDGGTCGVSWAAAVVTDRQ